MKTDAVIEVKFLTFDEGGRLEPLDAERYSCPLLVRGQALDCRFVLRAKTHFEPGVRHEIEIVFLNPGMARDVVREADAIELWEGRVIARGAVKRLRAGAART